MPDQPAVGLIHIGEPQPSAQFLINHLEYSGYQVRQYNETEGVLLDSDISSYILNLFDNELNIDDLIEQLSDQQANIIFNDARISNELVGWNKNRWLRHVLHKIDQAHDILPQQTVKAESSTGVDLTDLGIHSVWILAASIGGPESLIRFFKSLSGDEQVLFLVVQHMDSEFSNMMEKQLNKNGVIPVKLAESGLKVAPASAVLVPVDEAITINSDGTLGVKDVNQNRMSTPCIDDVCFDMIDNLSHVNMAIFSGMAKDGVRGATNVFENGGKVITQSAESCVVSAIAEEVRRLNMSLFDGDPESMAQYMKETLAKE